MQRSTRRRLPCSSPTLIARLALALLMTSPVAHAELSQPFAEVLRWDMDPTQGVTTLAISYAPDIKVGTYFIVDDDDAWRDAWKYFEFRGQKPPVDFIRQRVVVFEVPSICPGGGPGGLPVISLRVFDDGGLVPEFFPLQQAACPEFLMFPRSRGHAYALSIARGGAPEKLKLILDNSRRIRAETSNRAQPCLECQTESFTRISTTDEPIRRTASDRSAPLPELGQGLLYVFPDNTPFWLLRLWDGLVSAFDATMDFAPEWLPGLRSIAHWQPLYRWFSNYVDEWGVHASAARNGLRQYSTRVLGNRVEIGSLATATPPAKPARPRVPQTAERDVWPMPNPFSELTTQTVCKAIGAPNDSWVVIDGILSLRSEQPALICSPSSNKTNDCQNVCIPVVDLLTPEQCSGDFYGRFALRRDPRGFSDGVVISSFDTSYTCATRDGVRGMWDPNYGWGRQKFSVAASSAAQGAFTASQLYLGPLLEVTARYRWRLHWNHDSTFLNRQLGDTAELSLRMRRLYSIDTSPNTRDTWMLGLAPGLFDRPTFQHFTSSTLIGMLVPEVGVLLDSVKTYAYVGWSLPFEYRLVPAGQRQRPYDFADRMAIEFIPSVQTVFGAWPYHWIGGFSLGMTAW